MSRGTRCRCRSGSGEGGGRSPGGAGEAEGASEQPRRLCEAVGSSGEPGGRDWRLRHTPQKARADEGLQPAEQASCCGRHQLPPLPPLLPAVCAAKSCSETNRLLLSACPEDRASRLFQLPSLAEFQVARWGPGTIAYQAGPHRGVTRPCVLPPRWCLPSLVTNVQLQCTRLFIRVPPVCDAAASSANAHLQNGRDGCAYSTSVAVEFETLTRAMPFSLLHVQPIITQAHPQLEMHIKTN